MNVAAVRNNLRYAGWDQIGEPSGRRWRVFVLRPTDPRPQLQLVPIVRRGGGVLLLLTLFWKRLVRGLRRDHRWSVEVVPLGLDMRYLSRVDVVEGRDAAIERADRGHVRDS